MRPFHRGITLGLLLPVLILVAAPVMAQVEDTRMYGVILNNQPNALPAPVHPALTTDILAPGFAVEYAFQADSEEEYVVLLGLVERYWEKPGMRVMDVMIEGATSETVDIFDRVGKDAPLAVKRTGRDSDGDGWLRVKVAPADHAEDLNALANAVWVFSRERWKEENLSEQAVLRGQTDIEPLYFINCGTPGSDRVYWSFDGLLDDCGDRLQGFQMAKPYLPEALKEEVKARVGGWLDELVKVESRLGKDELGPTAEALRQLYSEIHAFLPRVEEQLAGHFQPFIKQSAETRLCSPWAMLARVRQEDRLKMMWEAYPRPAVSEFKWHSHAARTRMLDWIEVTPDTETARLSSALGLDYDLGLESIEYDPLETRYEYASGAVLVHVLSEPAWLILPESLELLVDLGGQDFKRVGDLYQASVQSRGAEIYYALRFIDPAPEAEEAMEEIRCRGLLLMRGDSEEELHRLAVKLTDWKGALESSRQWAQSRARFMNLPPESPYAHQVELNQRALHSMQFISGASLAALDGGYLFTWIRDSTIAALYTALGGDPLLLQKWAPYLMANASPIEYQGKNYRSFFTFPGQQPEDYGKLEQDGPFYAILSVYGLWKLTGDETRLIEWYPLLNEAQQYLRDSSFNPRLGLYSEMYVNEAPFKSAPEWQAGERYSAMKVGEDWPLRNYGLYTNHINYASHLMLSQIAEAIGRRDGAKAHAGRAAALAEAVDTYLWDTQQGRYHAGLGEMEDGQLAELDWNYWDIYFAYIWAVTLFPETLAPERSLESLDAILHQREPGLFPGTPERLYFAPGWAHAAWKYATEGQYEKSRQCLEPLSEAFDQVAYNPAMEALYWMKGAGVELIGNAALHRPEAFCIGPYFQAMTGQAAIIDFSGITLVPSGFHEHIEDLQYRGGVYAVDARVPGSGLRGIVFNDEQIPYTLKVPSKHYRRGAHRLSFLQGDDGGTDPLLMYTGYDLLEVSPEANEVRYRLKGTGNGTVRFRGKVGGDRITVKDVTGEDILFELWQAEGGTRVRLTANGEFTVIVKR